MASTRSSEAPSASVRTNCAVARSSSGSSAIETWLRRPPPQLGRRSSNSGRASAMSSARVSPRGWSTNSNRSSRRVTRPVEVLDGNDKRRLAAGSLDEGAPRGEQRGSVRRLRLSLADGRGQQSPDLGRLLDSGTRQPPSTARRISSGGASSSRPDDPEEHGAQRPVGQTLAVGQALRDGHARVRRDARQMVEELLEQARLACAGRRDDADQERPLLVECAAGDEVQLGQVSVTAEDGRPARDRSVRGRAAR